MVPERLRRERRSIPGREQQPIRTRRKFIHPHTSKHTIHNRLDTPDGFHKLTDKRGTPGKQYRNFHGFDKLTASRGNIVAAPRAGTAARLSILADHQLPAARAHHR